MDLNRWFSIATMAGLVGLVVLNYRGATQLFNAISDATINYVRTVQGR
jgi:hypothetical protein